MTQEQHSLQEQVELAIARNPETIANTIYPHLGPLIRGTVTDALDGMLRSFNETLRYSLTFRGLLWRFEALRTGRAFADVVLSKTMAFRVEQVFMIHGATGLLLQHVTDMASEQDPMMISGMLTAIQDFVHSSLGSAQGEVLSTLNVGETTIMLERGPFCFLAAVVRGTPPTNMRQHFAAAVSEVHRLLGPILENFDGDTGPFEPAKHIVEGCLIKELKETEKKFPWRLALLWGSVLAVVLGYTYINIRDGIYWRQYLALVGAERGMVIVNADKEDGKFLLYGLRDSYAADPYMILKQTKLNPDLVELNLEPYHSTLPEFVLQRKIDNQALRFDGELPAAADASKLDELAFDLLNLTEHMARVEKFPILRIYGNTNESEDANAARELTQRRADFVQAELRDRGVLDVEMKASGMGYQRRIRPNVRTEFDRKLNESVSFRVSVRTRDLERVEAEEAE